jgi:hypothetical protein
MWFAQAVIAPEHNAAVLATTNCATDPAQKAIAALTRALLLGRIG